ncbi:hypothetical protein P7K49_013186 [Saguinus oedipus]|uniref:Uncharacterized protein n=1 Tax=Saguinus oedipus TaxID=9490 RepID=A0ABQ9VFS2_SAGOE|nr:hypothetical protein P7K49_013186 [Saguinus oedipus]
MLGLSCGETQDGDNGRTCATVCPGSWLESVTWRVPSQGAESITTCTGREGGASTRVATPPPSPSHIGHAPCPAPSRVWPRPLLSSPLTCDHSLSSSLTRGHAPFPRPAKGVATPPAQLPPHMWPRPLLSSPLTCGHAPRLAPPSHVATPPAELPPHMWPRPLLSSPLTRLLRPPRAHPGRPPLHQD